MSHRVLPRFARVSLPRLLCLSLALVVVLAHAAAGQPVAPGEVAPMDTATALPAVNPLTGDLPSFGVLFATSPIINGLILGLSIVAVALFGYFMLTIHSKTMVPPAFIDEVTKLVLAGNYPEAASFCRANPHIFAASIIQRCVENAGKSQSIIMDMLDGEGRRRADIVWNRISYLADVANIAPMLGLLGTVVGMLQAFYSINYTALSASSNALTRAIGGAMATTFFGLIVAILAQLFYTLVKSRVTRSLAEAEQVVHSIADYIKRDTPTPAPAPGTSPAAAQPGARP